MWTVIKEDKKKIRFLANELKNKLGNDFVLYDPKLKIQKNFNNQIKEKEISLLGDYVFCHHSKFGNESTIKNLKFTRGLKFFLDGFRQSQVEIKLFIDKCKNFENEEGYLSQSFFNINLNKEYKFITGPFLDAVFKIVNIQKNKIDIMLGNLKTTIRKSEFLFKPL